MRQEQSTVEPAQEQVPVYSEPVLEFEGDLASVTKYWLTEFS